ncbi:hypothetical protein [Parvicella tangerina]|uniref:Rod shape-determining protein MreD n=1 Tax=Parvicella tangerina TaxID=2829795 RepID=A0A916JPA3_9FLAO|nr:hypothetical protein [Parvicella tangerina]CAG5084241.1 hypothetical protein CRYO30217_02414 [Parvicella tangerina]
MNPIIKYVIRVVLLILLQVIVLKNLELGVANWWVTPFVFIYLVIDFPVKFNPLYSMLLAGLLGFVIDVFYDTYGMHASAAIFMAFVRSYFIPMVLPRDGFDENSSATIRNLGWPKYLLYLFVMAFLYHLWFFMIEKFSFSSFPLRFSQALVSSLVAVAIMFLVQYLYVKEAKR